MILSKWATSSGYLERPPTVREAWHAAGRPMSEPSGPCIESVNCRYPIDEQSRLTEQTRLVNASKPAVEVKQSRLDPPGGYVGTNPREAKERITVVTPSEDRQS